MNKFKRALVIIIGTMLTFTDTDAQVLTADPVYGHSDAGTYSAAQANEYNAATMGNIERYHETALWGQNYPFNEQCFTTYEGSTHAKTGCVPTAYAIVMRHHQWPLSGTGILYNCQAPTYVKITDREYDYDRMPLVYDGNWSKEEIDEVAKLMSHIGHAFMVSYSSSSTSVSDPQSTDKISKYFNYNNVRAAYQREYTIEEWKEAIKNSLDNNCPIIYASDNAGTGDTRHMFVLDGYTENDYFHFNFGWAGSGNGWFKIDNIKPMSGDDYSWQNGADHYAIFNLTPNKEQRTVSVAVYPEEAGTVSVNGGEATDRAETTCYEGDNITLTATANSGYTFSHWSKDGVEVSTESSYTAKVDASDNSYVANFTVSCEVAENIYVTFDCRQGTFSNNYGSRYSTWTFTGEQELLQLKTSSGGNEVYALSNSRNSFYAYAYDNRENGHTPITCTLSAAEGYLITGYEMTYRVSSSHIGQVTVSNSAGSNTPTTTDDQQLHFDAQEHNAVEGVSSTDFTLTASKAGQQYITIENLTVTLSRKNTTSIGTAKEESLNTIYDLTGRRLERIAGPGIYIINGKKISVK